MGDEFKTAVLDSDGISAGDGLLQSSFEDVWKAGKIDLVASNTQSSPGLVEELRWQASLRRQRIREWDCEIQFVILVQSLARQNEILMVENLRCLRVLYPDPEWLGCPVMSIVPLEFRSEP